MRLQQQEANRAPRPLHHLHLGLAALAILLAAAGAESQTQQNATPANQAQRPTTSNTTQRPATSNTTQRPPAQAPASRWHLPFTGGNKNAAAAGNPQQTRHFWNFFGNRNKNSSAPAATANTRQLRGPWNQTDAAAQGRGAASVASSERMRLASLGTNQGASARAVQSQTFLGRPGPPGSRETQAPNGNIVRTGADGSIIDINSPKNGMSIHHALDGSRQVMVAQADGSRIFAPSRGRPYVQHPYLFQAQPFDHRTFLDRGQLSHQFYRPYNYGGTTLDVYAPQRFYSPGIYQWATSRFSTPQIPAWNYVATSPPWFAHYKSYFTPETSYTSPVLWLTDFLLATSLIAAYNTHAPSSQAATAQKAASSAQSAPADAAPVTPQVKELVADEVGRQVKEESAEAKANAQDRDLRPGAGGIVQELGDKEPHVFVAASDLDLVDPSGRRCMLSEGDVVQVISAANPNTSTASAVVLASKGGLECERAAQVQVALTDLQEMQNHMRATIDQGMADRNTGTSAATVTPAFAASAPPPDANAAHELDQQAQIAAAIEG
jgi:hypothetical protein